MVEVTPQVIEGVQVITAQPDAVATLDDDHARESRAAASNRWVREGRKAEADKFRQDVRLDCLAAGIPRFEANECAWNQCLAAFPPPGGAPIVAAAPSEQGNAPSVQAQPQPIDSSRLQGLGDVPAAWGDLPDNASLAAEIGWCQANRLRVVEERTSNLTVVHLDRARTPAPSWAALGWLETSIRSYAKFVDVAARALTTQTDEAAHVRSELIAIDDIRALLDEMHRD